VEDHAETILGAGTLPAESGPPAAAPSAGQCCPRHKTADGIRQVAIVYADVHGGDAANLLSPRPVLREAGALAWTGTGFGVAGMVAVWIGNAIGGEAAGPALLSGSVCFAYALAMYGWAGARRARLIRVERGIPSALALWRNAWYCERCDGVFFPDGDLMSVSEFRDQVWSAGGYADLLATAGRGLPAGG
jgi:hypothetical protein